MFTISYIYAVFLGLSGLFALIKANSIVSFCMSSLFAALIAHHTFKKNMKGIIATNLMLSVVFLVRFLKTYKFIVPGLFCLISLTLAAIFIFQRQRQSASQA